jgi:acyl-coenzyme A synthetase/AMP-(fatty) acid ligase
MAPTLEEWLDDTELKPVFSFTKSYAEVEDDPVFVVHTSGTTGTSKIT